MKREDFEYRKDNDPPAFESLQPTITLVLLMGYTKIYDPKCKIGPNLLGEVPLSRWRGWKDSEGNDYEYGFNGTTIFAQPKVTVEHGVNMAPTNEELITALKKIAEVRKRLGPENTFILGD